MGGVPAAGGSAPGQAPACGAEALALLNCVAGDAYGEGGKGCAAAMAALRECTRARKVTDFSLGGGGAAGGGGKAKETVEPKAKKG